MASKKYMIQPLTPPRQRKSSALSILAKYANSTGRTHGSKKRETEPFSPYSPSYDHSHSDYAHHPHHKHAESSLIEGQRPPSLETDLQFYRDYCHKERVKTEVSEDQQQQEEEEEEDDEEPDSSDASESLPDNVDFASWRRDMNSKLATQRRQIRSEKRRVERARKEAALAEALAASSRKDAPPAEPAQSQKPKYTLSFLGKSKAKKEENENQPEPRFMSMHGLITPKDDSKSPRSKDDSKSPRSLTPRHGHKKSASESVVDPRLFHTVRTPSSIEEEEAAITAMSKSKSLSPRSCSPTPAAKLSPRNNNQNHNHNQLPASPAAAAKISPRRASPAKVSPRKGSPAKVSPRSCSPTPSAKMSPRNGLSTPVAAEQQAPIEKRDRDLQTSQQPVVGVPTHHAAHGKRAPRNAWNDLAIAT